MNDELKAIGSSEEVLINNFIKNTCIVDFGTIVNVRGIDLVDVKLSSAPSENKIQAFTCLLGSFGGAGLMVKIAPKKGDKVLVLYPRFFSADMFLSEETVVDEDVSGYTFGKGIAFLANQYFEGKHGDNLVLIDDTSLKMTVKDKDMNITVGKSSVKMEHGGKITLEGNAGKLEIN